MQATIRVDVGNQRCVLATITSLIAKRARLSKMCAVNKGWSEYEESVTGRKQLTNKLCNLKHVSFALCISRQSADRDRSGPAWAGPARSSALFRPLDTEWPTGNLEAVH